MKTIADASASLTTQAGTLASLLTSQKDAAAEAAEMVSAMPVDPVSIEPVADTLIPERSQDESTTAASGSPAGEEAKKAASVFGEDFDIEIVEQHHNQKLDAPSGTALMIADAVSKVRENSEYVYDRHSYRKKRDKKEIGIHSVRGGNIVGEHEIIFAGTDEVLTISHSARSKTVFAVGAVNAAVFLADGKKPGMYDMSDLLASK